MLMMGDQGGLLSHDLPYAQICSFNENNDLLHFVKAHDA